MLHIKANAHLPYFTCGNETLNLSQIIFGKKLVSVTIGYLSAVRFEYRYGWFYRFFHRIKKIPEKKSVIVISPKEINLRQKLFGYQIQFQEKKSVTINDPKGITFFFEENDDDKMWAIRFYDEEEYEKMDDGDYDFATFNQKYFRQSMEKCYYYFLPENLQNAAWVSKNYNSQPK